jgi:hypothetical protein
MAKEKSSGRGFFSKLMFKEDEETSEKVNSGGKVTNFQYVPEVKIETTKVSPEVKISSPVKTHTDQNPQSEVDQKLFSDLAAKVHATDSPYIRLLQQLKTLESYINEEKMRFEAAANILKTMGIKKRDLIMAIETHESVLEDELKNFESSMESELKENIGGKKAELQGISNSITEKENEILKIQQEIVALKQQKTSTENYIQTRQQKVDLARRAFNSAYEAVKKILFNNKQNINNHIKGE